MVLGAVVFPLVGLGVAIWLLWGRAVTWLDLGLMAVMYVLTGLGVTLGFHRLFSHQSLEAKRPVELALAVLGSMSVQGPIFEWVANHRQHHQHSDDEHDPHSPHTSGNGFWGMIKGALHSHLGWLFTFAGTNQKRYVPDLLADRGLRFINSTFVLWVALGLIVPGVIGGLVTMSWWGAFLGFLWGGLVRICLLHHVTWSVNSVCHIWGRAPYESRDHSRNNAIFGVLALGEGWHNNHHAFPTSARHGLEWWQFDLTYVLIRAMEAVGLARRIRLPSAQALEAKRRSSVRSLGSDSMRKSA